MIHLFFHVFLLIFIAEMADKTQLLMIHYAKQYRLSTTIFSMFIGIVAISGCSTMFGSWIARYIPMHVIQFLASFLFLIFGFRSLIPTQEEASKKLSLQFPIITIACSFFIAELGDKTQLTAFALAADQPNQMLSIFLATTVGLFFANIFGIFAGKLLFRLIPERWFMLGSAFLFLYFGSIQLLEPFHPSLFLVFLYSCTLMIVAYFYCKKQNTLRE